MIQMKLMRGTVFTIEGAQGNYSAPSTALGELGDVVCIEGDCVVGAALVKQMTEVFASIGKPEKFKPAIDGILGPYRELESSWGRRFVPFHPACCTIKTLGQQAQGLTSEMLQSAEAAQIPGVVIPDSKSETLFKWATIIGAVATIGVVILKFADIYGKSKGARKVFGRRRALGAAAHRRRRRFA